MPYTADVVVAFMVAHGNRLLKLGAPIPYARNGQGFGQRVRFFRGGEGEMSFESWATQGGVERLGIMLPARVHASRPRLHETKEPAHGLVRELGSNSVLVARRDGADDVYLLTQGPSRRVTLEDADVVAFVERDANTAALQAHWLRWNAREGWPEESSWQGFARVARASSEQRMVVLASRVFAATGVSDDTRRAWQALLSCHTLALEPTYDFRFFAACEPLPLMTDRDGVRTRLTVALDAAAAFARLSNLAGWDQKFEAAAQAIQGMPDSGLANQLFEGVLATESLSLLDAAWRGDISGGTGSWNDLEAPAGYDRISSALRDALGDAVEAALNAA
jgi:hypothetical protein